MKTFDVIYMDAYAKLIKEFLVRKDSNNTYMNKFVYHPSHKSQVKEEEEDKIIIRLGVKEKKKRRKRRCRKETGLEKTIIGASV